MNPRWPSAARASRLRAARRRREHRKAEEAARSRKKRKRILIGAGATVGIVALIAIGYQVAQPDEDVQARCVDEDTNVVVDDANCATPASSGNNYHAGGGIIPYPIFIGGGGRQYRYNYGGSGNIGQPVAGGTATVPKGGTRVTTPSGKSVAGSSGSGSVSRGGFGVSNSGSSGS